jgi:hypothetical protein
LFDHDPGTLTLAEQTLVVFVDDTGHERLVEGHPVYGLGDCAAMAHDLELIIRHPWHEVRRKLCGSPNMPLHAAALGHPPRREDIEMVAEFFRSQPFARIGAIISTKAARDDGISAIGTIATVLKQRIVDIARWTPCTEVNVIFEASGRADRVIEDAALRRAESAFRSNAFSCPRRPGIPRSKSPTS